MQIPKKSHWLSNRDKEKTPYLFSKTGKFRNAMKEIIRPHLQIQVFSDRAVCKPYHKHRTCKIPKSLFRSFVARQKDKFQKGKFQKGKFQKIKFQKGQISLAIKS